jgi:hypothetical protein
MRFSLWVLPWRSRASLRVNVASQRVQAKGRSPAKDISFPLPAEKKSKENKSHYQLKTENKGNKMRSQTESLRGGIHVEHLIKDKVMLKLRENKISCN